MKAVYYFVPDDTILKERDGVLDLSIVTDLGLSHAFADRLRIPDQTVFCRDQGPSGQGVILFPKPAGCTEIPACQYKPELQDWHNCDSFWIGVEKEGATDITSEYFRKPSQTTGYSVADNLGDEWLIPVIRSPDPARYCLPTEYHLGFKGEFSRKRREQDERLWQLAGQCRDFVMNGEGMTEDRFVKAVVEFIGVNYFVSVSEVALLEQLGRKILQSEFVAAVMAAVNDFRLEEDVQKKSGTTEPTNSTPGQQESTPATDPAAVQSVS